MEERAAIADLTGTLARAIEDSAATPGCRTIAALKVAAEFAGRTDRKEICQDPDCRAVYEGMAAGFALARSLIEARSAHTGAVAGAARKAHEEQRNPTSPGLGSGAVTPTTDALERFAKATGSRLKISFEPAGAR